MVARDDAKISELPWYFHFNSVSWFRSIFRVEFYSRRIFDEYLFLVSPAHWLTNCSGRFLYHEHFLLTGVCKKLTWINAFFTYLGVLFFTVLWKTNMAHNTSFSCSKRLFCLWLDGLPRMLELFEFAEIQNFIPDFNFVTKAISDSLIRFQIFAHIRPSPAHFAHSGLLQLRGAMHGIAFLNMIPLTILNIESPPGR